MIIRTIAGTAVTLAVLGVLSQSSPAVSLYTIGASCWVQDSHDGDDVAVGNRSRAAATGMELAQGAGICEGPTLRTSSSAAYFAALKSTRTAHPNVCARTNAFVPVSYLSRLPR